VKVIAYLVYETIHTLTSPRALEALSIFTAKSAFGGGLSAHMIAAAVQKIGSSLTNRLISNGYRSVAEFPILS
jgi:hypothetical protein